MSRFSFVYPIGEQYGLFLAEIEGEADVFGEFDMEISLHDHKSGGLVSAPEEMRLRIVTWLTMNKEYDDIIFECARSHRAGRVDYFREIGRE